MSFLQQGDGMSPLDERLCKIIDGAGEVLEVLPMALLAMCLSLLSLLLLALGCNWLYGRWANRRRSGNGR